jgi:hypothetical protein
LNCHGLSAIIPAVPPEKTPSGAGPETRPYFKVALNLPHAGRVAWRIDSLLSAETGANPLKLDAAMATVAEIRALLEPAINLDDNPPPPIALEFRNRAAELGRRLAAQIESGGLGHDRLGQCVRNYFECLELGLEGADISLRAGENPKSLQRPF